ncbi:MAG TPA: LysR substrate-binding domain-containing protein [Caulobacteraceae bacterium]|jgi:LysR family glycine cleavage system transcriptional activator|nr:LysR substrate-binding domain-containing protein [Caulobacteraceae bacterium]
MSDILASIPLSAIRIFEAAARLKSFTRAADELGVTQAAVSWQVKALEQRLGQALFRRLPREVAPTEAGERLARAASEAMSLLRAALADLTETGQGVLAISTLQSLASQWLAPRLGVFQLAHPGLAVRLETTSRNVDLRRENIDVALRLGRGDWTGLAADFLFPAIQVPVCAPETKAQLGIERPEDLLRAPRIGAEAEWATWFAAMGVAEGPAEQPSRLIADLQTVEVAAAMAGHGVALGVPRLFAAEIASGRLIQLFDPPTEGLGYWLVYPEDRRRSPKIAPFREWLLACAAEESGIGQDLQPV